MKWSHALLFISGLLLGYFVPRVLHEAPDHRPKTQVCSEIEHLGGYIEGVCALFEAVEADGCTTGVHTKALMDSTLKEGRMVQSTFK